MEKIEQRQKTSEKARESEKKLRKIQSLKK